MTISIQKHNMFLRSTKQRIVQNLNHIDFPIDITTSNEEDMDVASVTLRKICYQCKDDDGGQLFDTIDKKNMGGTY
jgi:hypothetical protein